LSASLAGARSITNAKSQLASPNHRQC
jgi:hypothetical protein